MGNEIFLPTGGVTEVGTGDESIIEDLHNIVAGAASSLLDSVKIPESKELIQKKQDFLAWMNAHPAYEGIEKIRKNITLHEDGIHIETSMGMKILAWKGHVFGGVNTLGENLKEQKYSIEELCSIIEALGGQSVSYPYKRWEKIGGPEISSFLCNIAGLKNDRLYWSSSEQEDNVGFVLGIGVNNHEVFIFRQVRRFQYSSLASQNS